MARYLDPTTGLVFQYADGYRHGPPHLTKIEAPAPITPTVEAEVEVEGADEVEATEVEAKAKTAPANKARTAKTK